MSSPPGVEVDGGADAPGAASPDHGRAPIAIDDIDEPSPPEVEATQTQGPVGPISFSADRRSSGESVGGSGSSVGGGGASASVADGGSSGSPSGGVPSPSGGVPSPSGGVPSPGDGTDGSPGECPYGDGEKKDSSKQRAFGSSGRETKNSTLDPMLQKKLERKRREAEEGGQVFSSEPRAQSTASASTHKASPVWRANHFQKQGSIPIRGAD